MSRRVMQLTPMASSDELATALEKLKEFADVLMPTEAEEPILSPSVRAAIFDLMAELRNAEALESVGVKPRRTVLLFGPPGCGKTTLAHHLAARLGFPLAVIRSESLVDKYLGATGRNIGQLFSLMRATEGKVVIFFDEIDAIGTKRQAGQGADVERASALTVMLRQIEQFQGIAFGATNRQGDLDSALWRRFHMQISVDLPGEDERFAIIRRYGAPFVLSDDDVELLTEVTRHASPALLRGLMEGLKRALVMAPIAKRDVSDPVAIFRMLTSAVAPPPEFEDVPPLWKSPTTVERLAALTWPLVRAE